MSPRAADPDLADRLVEVAARLLAEEGHDAVSARRVATEAGVSTMGVYTHFGSMDDLINAVRREGFRRFGLELERPKDTDDPVADFMAQGWGYRHFALQEPNLYEVMFRLRRDISVLPEDDREAATDTFRSLLAKVERCVESGRWSVDEVWRTGEVVWSTVHGAAMIERSGYYEGMARDAPLAYGECLLRLSIGFGDDPARAAASLAAARRRARRAGQSA